MIRVLLVDDSAVVRRQLALILATTSDIAVVGEAGDAFAARDLIVQLRPDVLRSALRFPSPSAHAH